MKPAVWKIPGVVQLKKDGGCIRRWTEPTNFACSFQWALCYLNSVNTFYQSITMALFGGIPCGRRTHVDVSLVLFYAVVCMWRNRKAPSQESHKCLKQRNVSNVQSESDGDKDALKKRNLKLLNWHKLLLPCRGTCLHTYPWNLRRGLYLLICGFK